MTILSREGEGDDAEHGMIALIRVRLAAGAVFVLSGAMAVILFVAAFFSHQALLFAAALIAVITSMLAQALIEGWRAWLLQHSGAWVGLDGKPRSRAERPGWFKAWLTMHVLYAGVAGGAAAYLTWTLFAFIL